jgi:hypothetical protein
MQIKSQAMARRPMRLRMWWHYGGRDPVPSHAGHSSMRGITLAGDNVGRGFVCTIAATRRTGFL